MSESEALSPRCSSCRYWEQHESERIEKPRLGYCERLNSGDNHDPGHGEAACITQDYVNFISDQDFYCSLFESAPSRFPLADKELGLRREADCQPGCLIGPFPGPSLTFLMPAIYAAIYCAVRGEPAADSETSVFIGAMTRLLRGDPSHGIRRGAERDRLTLCDPQTGVYFEFLMWADGVVGVSLFPWPKGVPRNNVENNVRQTGSGGQCRDG